MHQAFRKPLILLYSLNLLDLLFTFIGLRLLLIEEANPIMAMLYEMNPTFFILIKSILVLIGIFVIGLIYNKKWVRLATYGLCGIYLIILSIHLNNFFNVYVPHIVGML